jgi:hypothetical protein
MARAAGLNGVGAVVEHDQLLVLCARYGQAFDSGFGVDEPQVLAAED